MKTLAHSFLTWFLLPFRPARADVLQLINEARRAEGLDDLEAIPTGVAGRPDECPLAKAVGGFVGADGISFDEPVIAMSVASAWHTGVRQHANGNYIVNLPNLLKRFVRDFDMGAYRNLGLQPA